MREASFGLHEKACSTVLNLERIQLKLLTRHLCRVNLHFNEPVGKTTSETGIVTGMLNLQFARELT